MKRKKLDQVVYEYIVKRIDTGQLFEREHITEQTVADELDISRTPVRRAFDRLEKDNYLENIANMGVRVKVQKVTSADFRNRLDFFERLVNHYLFDLEKKELDLSLEAVHEQLDLMAATVDDEQNDYEQHEFQFWNEVLTYESNTYSVKMLLCTLREILEVEGEIKDILKASRALKLSHYQKIATYLVEESYSYARREIRILVNQIKLNVIEMSQAN